MIDSALHGMKRVMATLSFIIGLTLLAIAALIATEAVLTGRQDAAGVTIRILPLLVSGSILMIVGADVSETVSEPRGPRQTTLDEWGETNA